MKRGWPIYSKPSVQLLLPEKKLFYNLSGNVGIIPSQYLAEFFVVRSKLGKIG